MDIRYVIASAFTVLYSNCSQFATDFYQAITSITSGLMLPLTTANLLAHAIIGSVLENLDMERLIREVGQAVAQRILGNQESVDDVARELHERLLLRNENTKKVVFENIYKESAEAKHNVQVFSEAPNLAAARPLLKKVRVLVNFHVYVVLIRFFRFMVVVLQRNISPHDKAAVLDTLDTQVTHPWATCHPHPPCPVVRLHHLQLPLLLQPARLRLLAEWFQISLHSVHHSLACLVPRLHLHLSLLLGTRHHLELSGMAAVIQWMKRMKKIRRFSSEKVQLPWTR